MKHLMNLIACIGLLLFVSVPGFSQSQGQKMKECSSMTTTRNIEFDQSSEAQSVNIAVSEGNSQLCFGISSTLKSGDLTVEIYDPNGKDYGNFSIEGNSNASAKNKDMVCGQINKQIKDPIKGDWVVKLLPSQANGQIAIHTLQLGAPNQ